MVSKIKSITDDNDKPHKWELVVVDWVDASFSDNHDFAQGEVLEPVVLRTSGFIVKRTKKVLTLAGEYCPEDNSTRHQWTILVGNIKKITKVKFT